MGFLGIPAVDSGLHGEATEDEGPVLVSRDEGPDSLLGLETDEGGVQFVTGLAGEWDYSVGPRVFGEASLLPRVESSEPL